MSLRSLVLVLLVAVPLSAQGPGGFRRVYPRWMTQTDTMQRADFLAEVDREQPAS